MKTKLYRVGAFGTENYECSKNITLGIFDNEEKAEECKEKHLKRVEETKNIPNPLTEEEKKMAACDWSEDRWHLWRSWLKEIDKALYFKYAYIEEFILNEEVNITWD